MDEHLAVVDFTRLSTREFSFILQEPFLGFPLVVRNLMALERAGCREIAIQYRIEQDVLRKKLEPYPFLSRWLSWFPVTRSKPTSHDLLAKISLAGGCFWVHPCYFVGKNLLNAFRSALPEAEDSEIRSTTLARENLLWLSETVVEMFAKTGSRDLNAFLEKKTPLGLTLPEVAGDGAAQGAFVQTYLDVPEARQLLLRDSARPRNSWVTRRIYEPISLLLARGFARLRVNPLLLTTLKLFVGILASCLIIYGAKEGIYGTFSLAALLFYLSEILDGVDGEAARLTYRTTRVGKRYDRISDAIIASTFLLATLLASYLHLRVLHRKLALGLYALLAAAWIVLTIYPWFFSWWHFEKGSWKLFRSRFWEHLPPENRLLRFIAFLRPILRRDLLLAFAAFAIFFAQPELVFYAMLLLSVFAASSLIYLSRKYRSLAHGQRSAPGSKKAN